MSGRRNAGRIELAGLWLGIAADGRRSCWRCCSRARDNGCRRRTLARRTRTSPRWPARLVALDARLRADRARSAASGFTRRALSAATAAALAEQALRDPSAAAVGIGTQDSALGGCRAHGPTTQMSKRHRPSFRSSIQENRKPAFVVPTLEQIHAARRDVDWAFVESVRQLCTSDPAQALERVRLMTFDDLLRKVGVPTEIRVTDDGSWIYARESHDGSGRPYGPGIRLRFVGDSVSFVNLW